MYGRSLWKVGQLCGVIAQECGAHLGQLPCLLVSGLSGPVGTLDVTASARNSLKLRCAPLDPIPLNKKAAHDHIYQA